MAYIVTVKLPKNKEHDPKNKKTDVCPVSSDYAECTDATGEHHSFLAYGNSAEEVRDVFKSYYHVTRVEMAMIRTLKEK
jgi:hypothetical protein